MWWRDSSYTIECDGEYLGETKIPLRPRVKKHMEEVEKVTSGNIRASEKEHQSKQMNNHVMNWASERLMQI